MKPILRFAWRRFVPACVLMLVTAFFGSMTVLAGVSEQIVMPVVLVVAMGGAWFIADAVPDIEDKQ